MSGVSRRSTSSQPLINRCSILRYCLLLQSFRCLRVHLLSRGQISPKNSATTGTCRIGSRIMKKLIGLLVLVITFSLVGFQSYSQREGRADFASLQNRVQTTRATLVQRDVAIKTLHTALIQTNEAIVRDSARLDAFEAKHRGGISDYRVYRDYKKRV